MLIYPQDNPNYVKYRSLDKEGLIIQVILGDTGEDAYLEGVRFSITVPEICGRIQQQTGIHASRQRLFFGGEEMRPENKLADYYSTSASVQSPKNSSTITMRCFIPLLVSTLQCPGPMMTEIEVRPKNDEPVAFVKRRIRDKFRIEVTQQRLHVHPAEMTSYVLRQPLDDARLLSTYLSPYREGNFLELVVLDEIDQNDKAETKQKIFVRIPRKVADLRKPISSVNELQYSMSLHCAPVEENKEQEIKHNLSLDHLPPPPPPQTPESDTYKEGSVGVAATPIEPPFSAITDLSNEVWWFTLPIRIDEIIKRDPLIADVRKVLIKTMKQHPIVAETLTDFDKNSQVEKSIDKFWLEIESKPRNLPLKYIASKSPFGGKAFDPIQTCYNDLLLRHDDMTVCVCCRNLEEIINRIPVGQNAGDKNGSNPKKSEPILPLLKPLVPLQSYDESRLRFTGPRDPINLFWSIEPSSPTDCGAKPGANVEVTAVSYIRSYGSWDIPEHRKTYVEITAEGSFHVGDSGLSALILHRATNGEDKPDFDAVSLINKNNKPSNEYDCDYPVVYYVQDTVEIQITGPVGRISGLSGGNLLTKPFGNSGNEFVYDRKKLFDFQQNVRRGENRIPPMPKPAPFYKRIDERCIDKTTGLFRENIKPSWDDRRQLSETAIGQWYLSRERVTDGSIKNSVKSNPAIATLIGYTAKCERGMSADGRPFMSVKYTRRIGIDSHPGLIFPRTEVADSIRKALDFRIQAQFYICHLSKDQVDASDPSDFTVSVKQSLTRVEHISHTPDKLKHFHSPNTGMETSFKVNMATLKWHEDKGYELLPTIELQK